MQKTREQKNSRVDSAAAARKKAPKACGGKEIRATQTIPLLVRCWWPSGSSSSSSSMSVALCDSQAFDLSCCLSMMLARSTHRDKQEEHNSLNKLISYDKASGLKLELLSQVESQPLVLFVFVAYAVTLCRLSSSSSSLFSSLFSAPFGLKLGLTLASHAGS